MNHLDMLLKAERQVLATEKMLEDLSSTQFSFEDEVTKRISKLFDQHKENKEKLISCKVSTTTVVIQLAILLGHNRTSSRYREYDLRLLSGGFGYRSVKIELDGTLKVGSDTFDDVESFIRYATEFELVELFKEVLRRIKDLIDAQHKSADLFKKAIITCQQILSGENLT